MGISFTVVVVFIQFKLCLHKTKQKKKMKEREREIQSFNSNKLTQQLFTFLWVAQEKAMIMWGCTGTWSGSHCMSQTPQNISTPNTEAASSPLRYLHHITTEESCLHIECCVCDVLYFVCLHLFFMLC